MSSDNPVSDIAEGVTKGALDWTVDKIVSLARGFKDRKLAFIRDEETIKIVKEQYNSGELSIYKNYIEDNELLFILKLGLTLRKLDLNLERKQNLRRKIMAKYEVKGLHIAQFVENGLLNRYIGILIENIRSVSDFKKRILLILNEIEKHVIFVKTEDTDRGIIQKFISIISAYSPSIFIVSGIFSAAEVIRKCEARLVEFANDYDLEKISSEEKENLFFKRKVLKIH
jgi:hypothetical protein